MTFNFRVFSAEDDIKIICPTVLFALRDLGSIGKHAAQGDSS